METKKCKFMENVAAAPKICVKMNGITVILHLVLPFYYDTTQKSTFIQIQKFSNPIQANFRILPRICQIGVMIKIQGYNFP